MESERNIDLLFHLLMMHSLVDSFMCPNERWNSQPWCIGATLQQIELPSQGQFSGFFVFKILFTYF